MDTRLQHPFSCILAGPSNSGKSYFVKQLLTHADTHLSHKPDNIVWFYACWQKLYDDLSCSFPHIRFIEGLPATFMDDELFPPGKVNLTVVDDLMDCASDNLEVEKAFTKYVHHRNLSIMYLVQNVFCQGKKSRTINLNTKYMVLFKNPRDKLQIVTLSRQMYPGKSRFFLESFEDATRDPYGYLLVDLRSDTPEELRLRTGFFPPSIPAVYVIKKPSLKS